MCPSGNRNEVLAAPSLSWWFSHLSDRMDQDFGLCLMKDGTKISIEPHINIGSRFQAEIPTLQDRPGLGSAEQAALVWKPWGDIATNEETQDRGCFTLYLQEFGGPLVKNAFAAAFCTPRGSALLFRALFHGAEVGLGAGAVGCEWLCAPRWAAGGGQLGGSPQQCPSPLFFGTPWVLRWGPMRFDFHCLAVMELLNMACSSVMPGGGTNLELALHCLHEARGNVVVRSRCRAVINSATTNPSWCEPGAQLGPRAAGSAEFFGPRRWRSAAGAQIRPCTGGHCGSAELGAEGTERSTSASPGI